jgi:hypothetical protein
MKLENSKKNSTYAVNTVGLIGGMVLPQKLTNLIIVKISTTSVTAATQGVILLSLAK